MELYQISLCIIGGLLAGIINTLAGSGSAITLGILTEVLGLPGNLANGSNRVGVTLQGLASTTVYARKGKLDMKTTLPILIPTFIGAICGVIVAIQVTDQQFMIVFRYLMLALLITILVNPKKWLISENQQKTLPLFILYPIYLSIGFYGGFIQMGMGIIFLAASVLIVKHNLSTANGIKILVVTIYSVIVLAIFHSRGLVDWYYGGTIAVGQVIGGILAARFATSFPHADLWTYRLLILIIVSVLISQFGIIDILSATFG